MNVKASEAAEESPLRPVEEGAATSSFAEVARIITGDYEPPPWLVKTFEPAFVISWSTWRRTHQAAARNAHVKRNLQLQC